MPATLRPQSETNYPQLGGIDHFIQFQKASHQFKEGKLDKLYAFMSEHRIAESIAYFIAQNDTPMRGQSPLRRAIDTRRLPGYDRGPIIHAEYYYDVHNEDRYVYLAGRRWPKDSRNYNIKMFLKDDLELDTDRPPEAHALGGPYPNKTFRIPKYVNPDRFAEYDERNPIIFLQVLGAAMLGLQNYVQARDNS